MCAWVTDSSAFGVRAPPSTGSTRASVCSVCNRDPLDDALNACTYCTHMCTTACMDQTLIDRSHAVTHSQAAKLQQMSLKPKAADGEGKLLDDDEEVRWVQCAAELILLAPSLSLSKHARAHHQNLSLHTHPLAARPSPIQREPHQSHCSQEGEGRQPLPPQVPGGYACTASDSLHTLKSCCTSLC